MSANQLQPGLPVKEQTRTEREKLRAELLAIEYFDADYCRNPTPEPYETIAFQMRQQRRNRIIHLLSTRKLEKNNH